MFQSSRSVKLWHNPETPKLRFLGILIPQTLDRFINALTRVMNANMLFKSLDVFRARGSDKTVATENRQYNVSDN